MTSSDPRDLFRGQKNIPSPNDAARAYARFIPREELGSFASWDPGALGERRKTPRTADRKSVV